MNSLTIFSVMLILYSMDVIALGKYNEPSHRHPPRIGRYPHSSEESSEEYQRKPVCHPKLLRDIINQNKRTIDTVQTSLNKFEVTEQSIENKLKVIDNSLQNIQELNSDIGQKVNNQDELLRSFSETLANSDPNCNEVDNRLSTKADSTLEITEANNRILVTVEQQQNDLAEQLRNFKASTEASLKALSVLIIDRVIPKLRNLEQSLINMEVNQREIKSELDVLCRLKTLSKNILENAQLIEGQLTRINVTQAARLTTLKDDIERTIIDNSICAINPFRQLSREVQIIESKLGACENTENLLKDNIIQFNKNGVVVRTKVNDLKILTDEKTEEILQNQRNCGRHSNPLIPSRPT